MLGSEYGFTLMHFNAQHIEDDRFKEAEELFQFMGDCLEQAKQLNALTKQYEKILEMKYSYRGRPNQLDGLVQFLFLCARIYEEVTDETFTVDDFRENNVPVSITKGQKFLEAAMEAIYINEHLDEPLYRYTPSNFQNACVKASQNLRDWKKSKKLA